MIKILAIIGFVALVCIIVSVAIVAFYEIKEGVENMKWRHKYKHRFDKPPIAACYCKDCVRWNSENGSCSDQCNSRCMADNWFCCFAEPKKKEKIDD